MRITVLSGRHEHRARPGVGFHVRDLRRAALARGHAFVCQPWQALGASVLPGGARPQAARAGDVLLDDADAVLLRTMPAGSLEQVVFRMDVLLQLAARGVKVVNPPRSIELAVDKYLALSRMAASGVPTPATSVCQRAVDAMLAFDALGGDVVVKPLFGAEGFGLARIDQRDVAARTFHTLERTGCVIYVQQYIDHGGSDVRLFILGDAVIAAMRRHVDGDDWRTNIARGGRAEAVEPDERLCDIALRAARACGTLVAGVDIVVDRAGEPYVLEANAIPGWRGLARTTGIDIAQRIISFVEQHAQGAVHA